MSTNACRARALHRAPTPTVAFDRSFGWMFSVIFY
jgi:hypothetical protein